MVKAGILSRFLWGLCKLVARCHREGHAALAANIRYCGSASAQRIEYAFADEHIFPGSVHSVLWLQGIHLLDLLDGSRLLLAHIGFVNLVVALVSIK